jgi:hypothetical protein
MDEVDSRPWRCLAHFLPHDARAKTLVTGSSVLEEAVGRWGQSRVRITPSLSLADGIQAGRWLLQQPSTRFHSRTLEGLEALRAYHFEWDEDSKAYSRKPAHDWSSHSADAFRYVAVARRMAEGLTPKAPAPPVRVVVAEPPKLGNPWEAPGGRRGRRERV